MLTGHLIDGIDLSDYGVKSIVGLGGPGVDTASYSRGGRSGVAIARPVYRGFVFTIQYYIIGTSFSDYVTKRDYLQRVLRLSADPDDDGFRTLQFNLSGGTQRFIDVIIGQIKADLSPDNPTWGIITVPYQSEREYLRGSDKTKTVYIFAGGGFGVPFEIPLDMSVETGPQTETLTNNGNTDSFPTVRVYGTIPAFDLVNVTTGKTLSCGEALASDSDYIDFDFYNRTAVKNGTTNVLDEISGDWWWLQPGDNVVKLVTAGTDPDARAVFTYQDAYQGL